MASPRSASLKQFSILAALLAVILGFICRDSFQENLVHFSNDGRLGIEMTEAFELPGSLNGSWFEYWWLGHYGGEGSTSLNLILRTVLGPVGFSKYLVPVSMAFLGICAWILFRSQKMAPGAAIVAALAMALNSNLFSNACWGLGTRAMTVGFFFLAIAALSDWSGKRRWVRVVLGGFATGMAVMEGADNGVFLSLYVAAFVVFKALTDSKPTVSAAAGGFVRLALVVICAVAIAMQSMITLFSAAVKPMTGPDAPKKTAQQKWEEATNWSLPPIETLRVLIPGLYGYRMNVADGAAYRGEVGRTFGWEQHLQGIPRHSGAGEYAGILVVLLAGFATVASFRKKKPIFSRSEALAVRFWSGAAVISVLLAWGRYAPFYQLIYHLPYFNTIRLPIKFMHPFHACIGILCAYGLTALSRGYMATASTTGTGPTARFKTWLNGATAQDRWIVRAVFGIAVAFVLGWVVFSQSAYDSVKREKTLDIASAFVSQQGLDPSRAKSEAPGYVSGNAALKAEIAETANFAIREVALAGLVFAASGAVLFLGLSGWCGGVRLKWFWIVAGGLMVLDLTRADLPWIHYYDYREKYRSNGLFDLLKQEPWQQRVQLPPIRLGGDAGRAFGTLANAYHGEWIQEQFPYYRIQSLDMSQDPRQFGDKVEFLGRLGGTNLSSRLWELTNTRFLFGFAAPQFKDLLDASFDPVQKRFRVHTPFDLSVNEAAQSYVVETNTTGPYALIEFTGALPRAGLYTRWQVIPDSAEALEKIASKNFDPAKEVILSDPTTAEPSPDAAPGKVSIDSYSSRLVRMKAEATAPSVLLFIEHLEPAWKAYVDGKLVSTLRANYLVRGVEVPSGSHTVEFRLEANNKGIYLTVGSQIVALLLIGVVLVTGKKDEEQPASKP